MSITDLANSLREHRDHLLNRLREFANDLEKARDRIEKLECILDSLRQKLAPYGLSFIIDSGDGTVDLHTSNPPPPAPAKNKSDEGWTVCGDPKITAVRALDRHVVVEIRRSEQHNQVNGCVSIWRRHVLTLTAAQIVAVGHEVPPDAEI